MKEQLKGKAYNADLVWWKIYESLNLYSGVASYISDDGEDIMEIRYDDGMLIDVGKSSEENVYYITVVMSDDEEGWKKPWYELTVIDKEHLYRHIQETIVRFRS